MSDEPTPATPPAGDPGSTPAPGGPLTTPSVPPAGDDQEQMSLEEARKLRKEAQALRQRIKAIDDEKAVADLAKLGETERLNKQYATLQESQEQLAAELAEARVWQAVADQAGNFNFVISAKTLTNLLLVDFDAIEFEDGRPVNIEKLLTKLAKAEPDLVRKTEPAQPNSNQPGPVQQQQLQRPQVPALPAMNQGRTNIVPPSSLPPGKIPSLAEAYAQKQRQ